jgi:tRNA threonylcarbamoyladenosine biosynthesis protein TsaE
MLLTLPAAADTEVLGAALARSLPQLSAASMVVYFHGEIGAGKTTCIRSFLRARGVTASVRSPTYTLIESYSVPPLTCVHADLYRLRSANETEDLGFRELPERDAVLLIEWPEQGGAAVPPPDMEVRFEYDGEARKVRLIGCTKPGLEWLRQLRIDTSLATYVSNLT